MNLPDDIIEYLAQHAKPRDAWQKCEHGDLLLRWAGEAEIPRRALVLGACACARLALKYVPEGEERPLRAIETAEAWVRGKATLEEVAAASDAAWNAAGAATSDATWNAARAAARAAGAAASEAAGAAAGEAAGAAARAAGAAAWSAARDAAGATWDAARDTTLRECADAVRETIAWPIVAHALETQGVALGETWLETVARWCGVSDEARADLSLQAERDVMLLSREMAKAGRWDAKVLAPYWAAVNPWERSVVA